MLSFHTTKVELKASRKSKPLAPIEGGYIDRGIEGKIDREVIYSMAALTGAQTNPPTIVIDSLHNREISDLQPNDELEEVVINFHFSEQTVKVELEIHPEERRILIEFLRENCDVFAWRVEDMQGISEDVIINDDPSFKNIHQKSRYFSPEKEIAIKEEVEKLLKAGIIKEISYPKWLANVVMVKKANNKWRMCVDFTDLNKACPKDCFYLPRIDRLVDSIAGHRVLSFIDAYSGYHQIQMVLGFMGPCAAELSIKLTQNPKP